MKLVFYDDNNNVLDITKGVISPSVTSDSVEWTNGSVKGVKVNFILVDDTVEIGDTVTSENIAADQKENFKKVDQLSEIKKLKSQNAEIIFKLVMNGIM
jgi:hypothetical protein